MKTYVAGSDESLACGIDSVVRLHDVEAWVLEELLPHLLVELLREEEQLPAYLIQVPGERCKHLVIGHFQLGVQWLPLHEDLLGPWAQRGEGGAELGVLYLLPLVLVKPQHE